MQARRTPAHIWRARWARSGKRLGITANSHKVIRNLLDGARKTATETGFAIRCVQKVSEKEDDLPDLQFVTDNAETAGSSGSRLSSRRRYSVALGAPRISRGG